MTDDLVKRLRRDLASEFAAIIDRSEEAADRIEELQEALRRVIAVADRDTNDFRFARNALKGKQDD